MADYWKSNAKKFCEACKCWFADNKLSVEHHERGARHKAMVQARLRELSKNAEIQDREHANLAATLAQMETAAIASMSGKSSANHSGVVRGGPAGIGPMPIGGLDGNVKAAPPVKLTPREEARAKLKAEKERLKNLKRTAKQSTMWRDDEDATGSTTPIEQPSNVQANEEQADFIQWTQTYSPEGTLYFYNFYTGETSWTLPPNVAQFLTWEQYQAQFGEVGYTFESANSLEEYAQPPPPPSESVELEEAPRPAKVSRWSSTPSTEPKIEPEDDVAPNSIFAPTQMKLDVEPEPLPPIPEKRSAGGLLGGWVPVEAVEVKPPKQEKPKVILDDLPAEATQVQELVPTFDQIEAEALTFEEKKAPVTKKNPKVVEFKKRTKTVRSARVRNDD